MQNEMRKYMDLMEGIDATDIITKELKYIKQNTPTRLADDLEWTVHRGSAWIGAFPSAPEAGRSGAGLGSDYEDTGIDFYFEEDRGLVAVPSFQGDGYPSPFKGDSYNIMYNLLLSLGYEKDDRGEFVLSAEGMNARPFELPRPPVTPEDITDMADEITQDLYGLVKNIVKSRGFDDAAGDTRNQVLAEIHRQMSSGEVGIRS